MVSYGMGLVGSMGVAMGLMGEDGWGVDDIFAYIDWGIRGYVMEIRPDERVSNESMDDAA
jgi:hypothetical protein